MAFGAQVENRRGLCSPFTSTLRMTLAAALVWPELRMPRSSSLSLHEAVGLVDQQGRPHLLDVAEQCARRDVARQLRARRHVVEDNQRAGLAAAFGRRHQHHERRDVAGVHRPGVQRPQRQRLGCALRQHDVAAEYSLDGVQQLVAGNGGFPRLDGPMWQTQSRPPPPAARVAPDYLVERIDAHSQRLSQFATNAVIFGVILARQRLDQRFLVSRAASLRRRW